MIAIPNMDKPKNCAECFYVLKCKSVPRWVTADDSIPKSCPIIEIKDTEYEWCHGCKEHDQENHCCHRWSKTIWKTVAELEEYYGRHITKHDQTLVIDYPDTDDIQTILLMDDEGFTRVFEERRADD